MVVGVLRIVLHLPHAGSLKGKRQVLRSVIERVRARFDVAVAEVGDNDVWQRAVVGVAAVGNDRAFVNEVLDKVLRSIEGGAADCQIADHRLELVTMSELYGASPFGEERTLAEAEGLADPDAFDDDDVPSLEELEEAARRGSPKRR